MTEFQRSQTRALLRVRLIVFLWIVSAVIGWALYSLGRWANVDWLPIPYYIGNAILIWVVARGRLQLGAAPDGAWLDLVGMTIAPWLGPVVWYRLWRRKQTG